MRKNVACYPAEVHRRQCRIDEISFHPHMVIPHINEHLSEDVTNLDFRKTECLGLDAENEVLHFERKHLLIDRKLRCPASLNHERTCTISVKFCNGTEQIKKVAS